MGFYFIITDQPRLPVESAIAQVCTVDPRLNPPVLEVKGGRDFKIGPQFMLHGKLCSIPVGGAGIYPGIKDSIGVNRCILQLLKLLCSYGIAVLRDVVGVVSPV